MKTGSLIAVATALLLSGSATAEQVALKGRPFLQVAKQSSQGNSSGRQIARRPGPLSLSSIWRRSGCCLFRDGVPIAASTVSSGKTGHETPTGVFTILQKNEKHFSKTYNNAPMPNMQRLTCRGSCSMPAISWLSRVAWMRSVATGIFKAAVWPDEPYDGGDHQSPGLPHPPPNPIWRRIGVRRRSPIANASYEWHPERGWIRTETPSFP